MVRLYYRTKADTSPRGKDNILVHAMPEDKAVADEIISLILEDNDGIRFTCWQPEDPEKIFTDFRSSESRQINLYIPVITQAFLEASGRYCGFSMESMSGQGMFIMPVLVSADLIPSFTARFGSMHVICINGRNAKGELKKQLDRMLGGIELKEKIIKDAFTRKLFLSYRKKDHDEAIRILKAVHDTKWGRAAETWYDDFLIPGRDFNEEISEAMSGSEAVVLTVTPNLLEIHPDGEPNYVLAHEYPDACRTGKPVIPVEAVCSDRDRIEEFFPQIPPFVQVEDKESFEAALAGAAGDHADDTAPEDKDPYLVYLLGMAFFMGFRVEKDVPRALAYLQQAAEQGVDEAAEQLFFTYEEGYEVPRDAGTAMEWQMRAFEILRDRQTDPEDLKKMKRILFDDGLAAALSISGRLEESNGYCQDLIDVIDSFEPDDESEMILWKVESLLNQGDIDFGNPLADRSDEVNLRYMLQMTKEAEQCLEEYYGDENAYYFRLKSVISSSYSEYARKTHDYNKAFRFMFMAVRNMKEALKEDDSYENRFKMAQMQTNLAGCKYLLSEQRGLTSVMRDNYRTDSVMASEEAIRIYTKLYDERKVPGVADNLAMCYLNKSLALKDKKEIQTALQKGLDVIEMLEKDYPGEGQGTRRKLQAAYR